MTDEFEQTKSNARDEVEVERKRYFELQPEFYPICVLPECYVERYCGECYIYTLSVVCLLCSQFSFFPAQAAAFFCAFVVDNNVKTTYYHHYYVKIILLI